MRTNPDNDAEDETLTLAFSANAVGGLNTTEAGGTPIALATAGTAGHPNTLTIDDDETQTYVLRVNAGHTPTEGTPVAVTFMAVPPHDDGSKTVTLNLDKPAPNWSTTVEGSAATTATVNATTAGDGTPGQAITIVNPANDGNRVADTVTLTAHSGVAGAAKLEASLTVEIADEHALQSVTAMVVDETGKAVDPQPAYVEEGKSVMIAVMPVDKDGKVTTADEDLTIALAPSGSADARDYRLSSSSIKITSSRNSSDPVTLTAETDEDVGVETLVFDATVSGVAANGSETSMSAGVLSLDIMDATAKKIEPKGESGTYPPEVAAALKAGQGEDGMLNPGETVEIMTADLFTVAAGYTASYGVSVEGDAVSASASGETVTINALKAGESVVVVTGTARMAASSFEVSQDVSNVAEAKFKVTVVDMPLMITLEMPANVMEGNIVEGSSYDITAQANRMVTEAEGSVEVMIMGDRTQSDARADEDYTVSSATIMAGYDSATATLEVLEDMVDDAGHADGEQLVLYGTYGDDMETNSLTFTIWDTAVPALPLIAQLVLALFMALGGARLYRRRQG